MKIKEMVIFKEFQRVNGMASIVDASDAFVKLPVAGKRLARTNRSHIIHKSKYKRP